MQHRITHVTNGPWHVSASGSRLYLSRPYPGIAGEGINGRRFKSEHHGREFTSADEAFSFALERGYLRRWHGPNEYQTPEQRAAHNTSCRASLVQYLIGRAESLERTASEGIAAGYTDEPIRQRQEARELRNRAAAVFRSGLTPNRKQRRRNMRRARELAARVEQHFHDLMRPTVSPLTAHLAEADRDALERLQRQHRYRATRCRYCRRPYSWHDEQDGRCPDDDTPHPNSPASAKVAA